MRTKGMGREEFHQAITEEIEEILKGVGLDPEVMGTLVRLNGAVVSPVFNQSDPFQPFEERQIIGLQFRTMFHGSKQRRILFSAGISRERILDAIEQVNGDGRL